MPENRQNPNSHPLTEQDERVRRRAKYIGGAALGLAMVGAIVPGNLVGQVVQRGINTGITVIDMIPGVNPAYPEQPNTVDMSPNADVPQK